MHGSLADLEVAFLYLDAIALRVRMDKRVTSVPVLVALAVLADGQKQLVAMEMCGSESHEAWKEFLAGLVERGLRAPLLCIVDGNAGLRRALSTVWSKTPVQRCAVHKLRNLERKAPKHALAEVKADFHEIVYAESEAAARKAHAPFVSQWKSRCPGVVKSLEEAGDELFTMYRFPKQQWKNIRTTNVVERLNGEFPPAGEDAGLAAQRGRGAGAALRPDRDGADQAAQDRRLQETGGGDQRTDEARGLMSDRHAIMDNRNQPEAAAISNCTRSRTRPVPASSRSQHNKNIARTHGLRALHPSRLNRQQEFLAIVLGLRPRTDDT